MIIGDWVLNSKSSQISNKDVSLQLEPKLIEVLLYFAENPGVVISRDQLIKEVWNGSVVTEHAVNRVIGKLRKTLNEDSEEKYIITIPKKGYQLIAKVTEMGEESLQHDGFSIFSLHKLLKAASVLVLVLVSVTLLVNYFAPTNSPSSNNLEKSQFNHVAPFTSYKGQEDEAVYSPNGEFVAFTRTSFDATSSDVYVRNIMTGKTTQVTNSQGNEIRPSWSFDGRYLLVLRVQEELCQYVRIKLDSLTIEPISEEVILSCNASRVLGAATWASDNDTIYYPRGMSVSQPINIYSYQISSGRQRRITNAPMGSVGDYFTSISPTGNELVLLRSIQELNSEVHVFNLLDGTSRFLFQVPWSLNAISWAKDNQHLLYADLAGNIIEYNIAEKAQKVLWINADKVSSPVYSPIKDEIIFTSGNRYNSDIMRANIDLTKIEIRLDQVTSFVDSIGGDYHPQFANNSKQLAYFSSRSGLPQIWIKDIDGKEKQISKFKSIMPPSTLKWSSDDKRLLSDSGKRVYSISVETGNMLYHTPENITAKLPSWSKDNQTIYFSSNQTGDWQIWQVKEANPELIEKLTEDGGFSSQLDPSGQNLYFNKYSNNGIWRYNFSTQQVESIMPDFPRSLYYNWKVMGQYIYYLSDQINSSGLYTFDLLKRTNHFISQIQLNSFRGFSISTDQKEILWVDMKQSETNLKILTMPQ